MRILAAVALLSLAGCAVAPRQSPPSIGESAGEADRAALESAQRELDQARAMLARGRANDCPEVCRLSQLICTASERICAIAARRGPEPDFAARCQAAQRDCGDARAQCGECK